MYFDDVVNPEAYNSPPWWYDLRGMMILTLSYKDTLWSQVNFFSKNIKSTHLEGAIGTGSLSFCIYLYQWLSFSRKRYTFWGIDYAPEMLKGAKRKLFFKHYNIEHGDLTKLKYSDSFFDSVNLANSFHCIKDIELALVEIHRVLKVHGTFAMNVLLYPQSNFGINFLSNKINKWGQKKGILYRPYEEIEIEELLSKHNYKIVSKRIKGNALYVIVTK